MKTLVIHPDDRSTDFLKPIYEKIEDKTVIVDKASYLEIVEAIQSHDRIIMLGHGTYDGLLTTKQKWGKDIGAYVISNAMSEYLVNKDCISIWCNADKYIERHGLGGFYTGMFISEIGEASYYYIKANQETIDDSNNCFAELVGKYINEKTNVIHEKVKSEYNKLMYLTNEVAAFNCTRLYYKRYLGNVIYKVTFKEKYSRSTVTAFKEILSDNLPYKSFSQIGKNIFLRGVVYPISEAQVYFDETVSNEIRENFLDEFKNDERVIQLQLLNEQEEWETVYNKH